MQYDNTVLIIVAFYLLVVFLIGNLSRGKSTQSLEDYFVAGRSTGPIVSYLTYVATFHSSFTFLGAAGWLYSRGITFFAAFTSCVVSPMMIYFIGRPAWYIGQKHNFLTQGELLGDYYESTFLQGLVGGMTLIFLVPYLQSQLMAGGYIFETISNGRIPYWLGTIILYVIITGYILLGGFRAVAWNDSFQSIVMLTMAYIAGGIVMGKLFGTLNWSTNGKSSFRFSESITIRPRNGPYL